LVVETDYLLISAFTWDYDYPYIDWPVSFFDGSLGPDIVNWSWDLGNGALTNEVNAGFTYVSPGSYPITLKVTNIVGCEAVMTEMLDIEKGFRVTVPSAFTPNLDGLNDYFRPTLENIISLHLIVYNKYGSVVYETRDLDGEWDGSLDLVPLPQDSYLYEITYVAESGVARTSRGKVAMLR
jgi:gliding motility-associated-like protein